MAKLIFDFEEKCTAITVKGHDITVSSAGIKLNLAYGYYQAKAATMTLKEDELEKFSVAKIKLLMSVILSADQSEYEADSLKKFINYLNEQDRLYILFVAQGESAEDSFESAYGKKKPVVETESSTSD